MTNKNIIKYKIISNTISSIIFIAILTIGLIVFKKKILDYKNIITILYNLIILYSVFNSFIEPFFYSKIWNYKITDKTLEYTKGVFSVSKTIIPISRIQQVTIIKGPILNLFNLVKVQVQTTTKAHSLDTISVSEGDIIAKKISDILYEKSKIYPKENNKRVDIYEN